MARFLLRRIGLALVTLLLLSLIVFTAAHVFPGDVGRRILGPFADPRAVAGLDHQLGTDQPIIAQYWAWLSGAITGHLGTSLAYRDSVAAMLLRALANSAKLGAVAFVLVVPLGIM